MSDAAPCFSLLWISRRAEPSSRHILSVCLAEKEVKGCSLKTADQLEIHGQATGWKTFRHARIVLKWPEITPSRSRLNPIFCAMAVSAGLSAKTDSLAIDPPSRTRQNPRPSPTPPRRWTSRSPTGGRPDGRESSCGATVKFSAPRSGAGGRWRRNTEARDDPLVDRRCCRHGATPCTSGRKVGRPAGVSCK